MGSFEVKKSVLGIRAQRAPKSRVRHPTPGTQQTRGNKHPTNTGHQQTPCTNKRGRAGAATFCQLLGLGSTVGAAHHHAVRVRVVLELYSSPHSSTVNQVTLYILYYIY